MKIPLAFSLLCLALLFSFAATQKTTVLVIQQTADSPHRLGDTLYMQYWNHLESFDDTLMKHCGADTANIREIFIANPSHVIRGIKFTRFSKLEHLVLAGNDGNCLDTLKYDFFRCRTLKRITLSSVYINQNDDDGGDHEKHAVRRTRIYIHQHRRDIRVKYAPMGHYSDLCWP